MPRGIDRRNDPRNDLTREAVEARLVGSFDLNTGSLHDVGGKPIVGPAADRAKQQAKLAAEDRSWREWHANYENENEGKYFSHPDPEEERIERKQEQYREEGPDWGI